MAAPDEPPSWLGLIELFVVLLFALGWAIVELVALRMDRRRRQAREDGTAGKDERDG